MSILLVKMMINKVTKRILIIYLYYYFNMVEVYKGLHI